MSELTYFFRSFQKTSVCNRKKHVWEWRVDILFL